MGLCRENFLRCRMKKRWASLCRLETEHCDGLQKNRELYQNLKFLRQSQDSSSKLILLYRAYKVFNT